jgi:hypothetical protein
MGMVSHKTWSKSPRIILFQIGFRNSRPQTPQKSARFIPPAFSPVEWSVPDFFQFLEGVLHCCPCSLPLLTRTETRNRLIDHLEKVCIPYLLDVIGSGSDPLEHMLRYYKQWVANLFTRTDRHGTIDHITCPCYSLREDVYRRSSRGIKASKSNSELVPTSIWNHEYRLSNKVQLS